MKDFKTVEYKVRLRLEDGDAEYSRALQAAFERELARFMSDFNQRTTTQGEQPAPLSCWPVVQ